jgi:hypothetical protein
MDQDEHQAAIAYFNAAWDLIDASDCSAEEDREVLTLAVASRQHRADADPEDKALVESQLASIPAPG